MSGDRQVKVLFDPETIAKRIEELARDIAALKPKDLLVAAILKGSFMFAADLLRALHRAGLEPHVEFFHLSSYREGTVSSTKTGAVMPAGRSVTPASDAMAGSAAGAWAGIVSDGATVSALARAIVRNIGSPVR